MIQLILCTHYIFKKKKTNFVNKDGESVSIKTRSKEPSPPRVPPPKRGRADRRSLDSVSSISSISSVEKYEYFQNFYLFF